ncbi:hypothetical protein EVAR_67505_1 [Eumeta japonica]|uniref:Uncharacterized protein n=1 Tax=Eumeta variegata TaxID=151549 RepID=A0A4C2A0V5_EUMVA|nr:hypothetical protein EVAR_67505_1 [Eumeta japonica]
MKLFSGTHTGENIAKERNAIANRWDIEHDKIHLLIHDSGANMVKGVRLAEYDSARCFIHTTQKDIIESLEVEPEVIAIIAADRRLVTHFNHSGLAQENLLAIQNAKFTRASIGARYQYKVEFLFLYDRTKAGLIVVCC